MPPASKVASPAGEILFTTINWSASIFGLIMTSQTLIVIIVCHIKVGKSVNGDSIWLEGKCNDCTDSSIGRDAPNLII